MKQKILIKNNLNKFRSNQLPRAVRGLVNKTIIVNLIVNYRQFLNKNTAQCAYKNKKNRGYILFGLEECAGRIGNPKQYLHIHNADNLMFGD